MTVDHNIHDSDIGRTDASRIVVADPTSPLGRIMSGAVREAVAKSLGVKEEKLLKPNEEGTL